MKETLRQWSTRIRSCSRSTGTKRTPGERVMYTGKKKKQKKPTPVTSKIPRIAADDTHACAPTSLSSLVPNERPLARVQAHESDALVGGPPRHFRGPRRRSWRHVDGDNQRRPSRGADELHRGILVSARGKRRRGARGPAQQGRTPRRLLEGAKRDRAGRQ